MRGGRCPVSLFALATALAAGAPPARAQVRTMFVTSASGSPVLGSWDEAQGRTGAAAATQICRTLAAEAGLANADTYQAWISTGTDDAYCRLVGLAGKVWLGCGQAVLPNGGPWVRTDGRPFVRDLASLVSGRALHPPLLDEHGALLPAGGLTLLTATGVTGAVVTTLGLPDTCADWTYAGPGPPYLRTGLASTTNYHWTQGYFSTDCQRSGRLVCFESAGGLVGTLPAFEQPGALAFVTAATGGGELGSWPLARGETGLAAGDAICRNSAFAAGIPYAGGFVAWLSELGVADAIDRLGFDGPYKRLDGVEIAATKAGLLGSGPSALVLASPLDVTERGSYVGDYAITGTGPDGRATGNDCSGWTLGTSTPADHGFPDESRGGWTQTADFTEGCGSFFDRLYCFGDIPVLFWDGFEPGDAGRWWARHP